jgi:hypothetical protein
MTWGTPVEIERRRRIRLAVWAYAYEKLNESLVSDETFDREAELVDLKVATGNPKMDLWFRKNFAACTGQWVNQHPNQRRLHQIATQIIKDRAANG